MIILIQRPLISRIDQVRGWRSVDVSVEDRGIAEAELASSETRMGPLNGENRTVDDSLSSFVHVAKRGQLWEEVFLNVPLVSSIAP